jgi:ribonuclease Z
MRRTILILVCLLLLVGGMFTAVTRTTPGQDFLIERALAAAFSQPAVEAVDGGMSVFMCGTSSPLPAPDRAQACVAVLVDERIFVVDAGANASNVAALGGLRMDPVISLLLTHYHSDHIAAIADFNLASWVAGRPEPLRVVGPEGVTQIVAALNSMYEQDRDYRVEHHGPDLLPPHLHRMSAQTIEPGVIIDEDGLVVRAFAVDHSPVSPAVGYRFEYGGRSLVITGDAIVTAGLIDAARDADLLLADALSLPSVQAMEQAARAAGRNRQAKIFHDIQDYHASTSALGDLVARAGVRQLALYHVVPAPRNSVMKRVFLRDLPSGTLLTHDGMIFDLPAGSDAVLSR